VGGGRESEGKGKGDDLRNSVGKREKVGDRDKKRRRERDRDRERRKERCTTVDRLVDGGNVARGSLELVSCVLHLCGLAFGALENVRELRQIE